MKKQGKKLTSLLLAVMVVVGLMMVIPLTASAADEEIIPRISVFVTAPIAEEHPDFSAISGDPDKYTVKIDYWYLFKSGEIDSPHMTSDDTFVAGQTYAVRVWFYAKEGYLFDMLSNGFWADFLDDGETFDIYSGTNRINDLSYFEGQYLATCNHNYEITGTLNPTCEEQGYTKNTCTICGDKYFDYITAIGHNYGDWEVTTPATCEVDGVETRVCANDASHFETRAIDAIGHDYGEWEVTTPATCEVDGVETRVCANDASHTESRVIPAIGHNYVAVSATTSSTNLQDKTTVTITVYGECTNCGDIIVLASQSVKLKQNGTQTVNIGGYDVTVVVNGNNKITGIYLGSPTGGGNQNNQGQNGNGNQQ